MENSALKEVTRLLSQAIHTNQVIVTLLLHLEMERIIRETGRSTEDVTEEINARLTAIKEKIADNLSI